MPVAANDTSAATAGAAAGGCGRAVVRLDALDESLVPALEPCRVISGRSVFAPAQFS